MVVTDDLIPPAQHSVLAPARIHDFRLLFVMQLITGLRMPMQFFTQTWYINVNAPEDQRVLLLGLLATGIGLSFLAWVTIGGALADRFPRRTMLAVAHAVGFVAIVLTASLMIFVPAAAHGDGPWLIVMLVLFSQFGVLDAQDMPTRTAMIADIVPPQMLSRAITLNWLAMPITFLIAAPTVGWMIEHLSFGPTYLVASLGHLGVLLALWRLHSRVGSADPLAAGQSLIHNVRAGVAYLRSDEAVRWMMFLSWIAIAASQTAMGILIAVWVRDILGLDAAGWGRLALAWGAGGLIAATSLFFVSRVPKGPIFLAAAGAMGLAVLGFGLTRSVVVAACFFGLAGASLQLLMTLGTAIAQSAVPPHLMGRVMSLFFLSRGMTQAAGVLFGALGQLVGLPVLYPAIGLLMVSLAAFVAATRRPLRMLR